MKDLVIRASSLTKIHPRLRGSWPRAGRDNVSVRAVRGTRDETLPKCSEIFRILDKRSKTRGVGGHAIPQRLKARSNSEDFASMRLGTDGSDFRTGGLFRPETRRCGQR
jgi:hypothetical protein